MLFRFVVVSASVCLFFGGCGRKGRSEGESASVSAVAEPASVSPLEQMNSAIDAGDWEQAWELHRAVLTSHPDDSEVLVSIARVAFANDQRGQSADFLLEALRVDEYQDVALVKQTVIALTAVGRFFDAIDMLRIAVKQHPEQHELRRWLFDFLSAVELHDEAIEHGRRLIRQREFDFALLLELSNTEERKLENDSTDQLADRNPNDKRYLTPRARVRFDRGKSEEAGLLLGEIVEAHSEFLPAQILLGRLLADTGQFDQLNAWAGRLPVDHDDAWGYWMVLGDSARQRDDLQAAARAYWESIRRNGDVMQVWAKLAGVLRQLESVDSGTLSLSTERVQQRANLLSALYAQKDRFERSNRKSKAVVTEIASSLRDLGRFWEAEAWAAMGMTLPDQPGETADIREALVETRGRLVRRLRKDMPWQSIDEFPEMVMDLSSWPVPSFDGADEASSRSVAEGVLPQFNNEAAARGLSFFGRTRDDLNQPGISIYAELGCGGGAIDLDRDGWPDLYLMDAGGTPPNDDSRTNRLFRNHGGQFVEITEASSTSDQGFGQGVAVGDVNADGFPDMLLLNYGTNRILINHGDGTFSKRDAEVAENVPRWSTSGAIADLDADGLPEMVVLRYCAGLDPVTEKCTDEEKGITKSCAPIHFRAERDALWKVGRDGTLADVTTASGFAPSIVGRGLGVVVGSLDQTSGLDVLVANDMTNNHFYSRRPGAPFQLAETGMLRGLAADDRSSPQASMGVAANDLDRDGDIDFYVTNFENEYNTYYEQRAGGAWQDRTAQQGLVTEVMPMVGFGCDAIDADNNGELELVIANGHVHFPVDEEDAPYAQPMQIFHRSSGDRYALLPGSELGDSYFDSPHVGRSLWTLDADRDGRMDFAVTHQTEPVALLLNQTDSSHHWIRFRLSGTDCGRDAIGSQVIVTQGDQRWVGSLIAGDGFQCSNERMIHFGLGDAGEAIDVEVVWSDGRKEALGELDPDVEWLLIQGQGAFRVDQER